MRNTRISGKAVRALLVAVLLLGVASSVAPSPTSADAAAPGTWAATQSFGQGRAFAPAVRLGDGSVLTAGGSFGVDFTAAAGRWDPVAGTWSDAGTIGAAVAGQVAAVLPSGKAIFAGGAGRTSFYGFGDLYDAGTNKWTQTPPMASLHAYAAAAQLNNGDLLVIGGDDGGTGLTTNAVDIYSAAGNSWSAGPSLPGAGRYAHTATKLADGRILVTGGNDGTGGSSAALNLAAIYGSASGWTATDPLNVARFDHAAVKLNDGRVLVVGGSNASGTALASAEIYNPATGHWTATGSMSTARYGLTLTVLVNGWVLAAGGYSDAGSPALTTAEIYDPGTGGWTPTGMMSHGRRYQSATLLTNGQVLVNGGHGTDADGYEATAEVYTPPLSYPATTFHPIKPARILDTRVGTGLSGAFMNKVARQLQVAGQGGVPTNAIAVAGIVTVTNETYGGYVSVGPTATTSPTSSTINFPAQDNRANNVAVALDLTGRLSLVFVQSGSGTGATTDVLFDVTGYFTADDTGATFKVLTPARVLDTRINQGLSGRFSTNVARTLQVTGVGGVPAGALAVSGNLTVVGPSASGWAYIGPSLPSNPITVNVSMINTVPGDTRADGVTVQLGTGGTLALVWESGGTSTADILFDVTGYFVTGTSGYHFVPVEPTRVADTRIGLPAQGPILHQSPLTVPVWNHGHIPGTAAGIAGNLTVVNQTAGGYVTAAPTVAAAPQATSTINFPLYDTRANGFYCGLAGNGSVGVLYFAPTSNSSHVVVDITGYFTP